MCCHPSEVFSRSIKVQNEEFRFDFHWFLLLKSPYLEAKCLLALTLLLQKFRLQIYVVELLCLMGFHECLLDACNLSRKTNLRVNLRLYGRMNVWKANEKREIVINMKTFLLFLDQRCAMILVKSFFSQNSWLFLQFYEISNRFQSSLFYGKARIFLSFTLNFIFGAKAWRFWTSSEHWEMKWKSNGDEYKCCAKHNFLNKKKFIR